MKIDNKFIYTEQLRAAFVAGAKWWEYQKDGATMWQTDQHTAWDEAVRRYNNESANIRNTQINQAGLMRCCLDTIETLPDGEYQNGTVIDCKHEAAGNERIILLSGVWQLNDERSEP